MCLGPIIGGIGLIMLLRVGSTPSYLGEVLPAIVVFGIGLSATVAPLTATVLDSVDERHVGIASGANNGISRVAGLLAIAVLGAVISAKFSSIAPGIETGPLTADAPGASAAAFHLGVLISGLLMIAGGIVSGVGIVNPGHRIEAIPASGAVAAGECGHGTNCDCSEAEKSPALEPA